MFSTKKLARLKRSNRDSLNIVRDMLVVAQVRVKQTKIMYQANLSYDQVKKYLRDLLTKGLLEHDKDSYYLITEKGLEFLRLHEDYVARNIRIEEQTHQSLKERRLLEQMCFSR